MGTSMIQCRLRESRTACQYVGSAHRGQSYVDGKRTVPGTGAAPVAIEGRQPQPGAWHDATGTCEDNAGFVYRNRSLVKG